MNDALRTTALRFPGARLLQSRDPTLRFLIDNISDCYLQVDGDFRITEINLAAAHWIDCSISESIGRGLFEIFEKADPVDKATVSEIIQSRQTRKIEILSKAQPGRWVEAQMQPLGDETAILFRDVTDRRAAELAGQKARDLMNSALDAMTSEIVILSEAGRVLVANRAWHKFMADGADYHQDNGIGEIYHQIKLLHPVRSQLQAFRAGIMAVLEGKRDEFRMNFRAKGGVGYRNYRLRVTPMDDGPWRRVLIVRDDVTELETALSEVDNMAVRLVNLQEQERQRYAAELHDSTVQHLTAASLNLMVLRERTGEDGKNDIVASVEESVSEAQREIRSVSYLLYPRALDEDGLRATLGRFVSGYSTRTGIKAVLQVSGQIDAMHLSLKRAVLRIVQEALGNVHRHAHAKKVNVAVVAHAARVSLVVSDNGRGLMRDAAGKIAKPGIGISGMRARAHQFGGCLKIRSSERGTLVFARMPIGFDTRSASKRPG
jgi:signal transduction histidine kinase